MLFVKEDFPSKLLSTANAPIKGFFIKVNLRKKDMVILWFL